MFSHYPAWALFGLVLNRITLVELAKKGYFFLQRMRKQYYALPQESLWLHDFYSNDNMKF